MNVASIKNCVPFIDEQHAKLDEWQANSIGENSESISEWTKSFIDERQVKSKNRLVTTDKRKEMSSKLKEKKDELQVKRETGWTTNKNSSNKNNGWTKSAMNEQNHEKRRESKECLFIYIFLISCFGLLIQQVWLWTTKTILNLAVHKPVAFSKPTSLVGSVLKTLSL